MEENKLRSANKMIMAVVLGAACSAAACVADESTAAHESKLTGSGSGSGVVESRCTVYSRYRDTVFQQNADLAAERTSVCSSDPEGERCATLTAWANSPRRTGIEQAVTDAAAVVCNGGTP